MKEKIKLFARKYLIGFTIGAILFGTIGVYAVTYFPGINTTYDNSDSGMTSTNVQDALDELYNVCTPPQKTGGTAILSKVQIVSTGTGLYEDEYESGKYTYKGANPNNYITFNEENDGKAAWRIISINPEKTIKIMRINSLEAQSWDTGNTGEWSSASLKTYLNNTYYKSLSSTAQNQIVTSNYRVGLVSENDNMQRQVDDENTTSWSGKVALATASEYIRACSDENCQTYSTYNDKYSTCKSSNWMFSSTDTWWTLSRYSKYTPTIIGIDWYGIITQYVLQTSSGAKNYAKVRPVVTLSSEVNITGGTGTQSDPYTISM